VPLDGGQYLSADHISGVCKHPLYVPGRLVLRIQFKSVQTRNGGDGNRLGTEVDLKQVTRAVRRVRGHKQGAPATACEHAGVRGCQRCLADPALAGEENDGAAQQHPIPPPK